VLVFDRTLADVTVSGIATLFSSSWWLALKAERSSTLLLSRQSRLAGIFLASD
jgi:hypothetical protein